MDTLPLYGSATLAPFSTCSLAPLQPTCGLWPTLLFYARIWERAGAFYLKCYLNVIPIKCCRFFIELRIKMFQILLWRILFTYYFYYLNEEPNPKCYFSVCNSGKKHNLNWFTHTKLGPPTIFRLMFLKLWIFKGCFWPLILSKSRELFNFKK